MEKPTIKAIGFTSENYVNQCFEFCVKCAECMKPGVEVKLIYNQLNQLGFNVNFTKAENQTSMLDEIARGNADISINSIDFPSLTRYYNLLPTKPLVNDKWILLIKQPETNHIPNLLFYKCHWSVWLFCLLTFLLILSYQKAVNVYYIKQYTFNNINKLVHTYPMIFWSISFGIVLNVYSQNLAICLFKKLPDVPLHDKESLYQQLKFGNCHVVIRQSDIDKYGDITLGLFPFLIDDREKYEMFNTVLQKTAIIVSNNDSDETAFLAKINWHKGWILSPESICKIIIISL